MKIKVNKAELAEVDWLANIIKKVEEQDIIYINNIVDEIFKKQPFFLSALLGLRLDIEEAELAEITNIYIIIWEYFKYKGQIPTKQITENAFEKIYTRHVKMLKYAEGEIDNKGKTEVYAYDLERMSSKALYTAVLFKFNNNPILKKMNQQNKLATLIGIKSFIECFEIGNEKTK